MITRTLKTAAIAATVILATTAGAFAATAWADGKVKVKEDPAKWADTVDYLHDGEKVSVLGCFTKKGIKWCEIEHKGPDGYVRMHDLDFNYGYKHADVKVCLGDHNFSFCLSN